MPFFSIIIPTHNRAQLIRATLESVFAQTFQDHEIIVVDDGSTDGTRGILASFGESIRVFNQANSGPGTARNLGATHATGTYLVFLDSDDLLFPWTLSIYRQTIQENQKPAFIAGKPRRFQNENELKTVAPQELNSMQFDNYLASGDEWRWWGASSFAVRADIFKSVGGFTNEWVNGEDADLALRLGDAPGFVQILSPVTFGYREHAASEIKNLRRTLIGAMHQIRAEKSAAYPGGSRLASQRRRILTRHIRPVSIACLQNGMPREGWELYRSTLPWHIRLGQLKYLIGFPLKALFRRS